MTGTPVRPSLSVVLATDCLDTIRGVVECLRRQTVRDRVELVIAVPSLAALDARDPALQGFASVRVVGVGSVQHLHAARAAAVRAAEAPFVFVGETHSLPHPGFAEALLRRHTDGWPVVVPGFGNANPDGALSWAIFLLDYGRSLHSGPAGEVPWIPSHNVSFEKEALLALGPALEVGLAHGDELTVRFRERGQRAYLEPDARIDHLNISRPAPWIGERFFCGLLLAARRIRRWSALRRLVYVAGSPLIPAVMLYRLRDKVALARQDAPLPLGTVATMAAGAVISSVGEMVGYALGVVWGAEWRMAEYELHKVRYTTPRVE